MVNFTPSGLLLCNLQRAKFQKLCIRALIIIISYNFRNVPIVVRAKISYNLNNYYNIRCKHLYPSLSLNVRILITIIIVLECYKFNMIIYFDVLLISN